MDLDTDAGAKERWEAAAKLAEGIRDERYRHRRTWIWLFLIALLIVVGTGGFLIAALLPATGRTDPSPGREWVAAGLSVISFVWIGTVFIHGLRSKTFIARWRAVLSPLNRSERRRVVKQWRGILPISDEELPVVRAAAVQTMLQIDFQFRLWGGMIFLVAGLYLNTELRFIQIMAGTSVTAYAIAALLMFRDRRRISGFLQRSA